MNGKWENEKRDLLDAAACFAAIAGFWLCVRGWRPGIAPFERDGLQYVYAYYALAARSGDLAPLYDPAWMGGVKLAATWVHAWFTKLAFLAGLRPVDALFATLVVPQWLLGFASLKLADGLALAFTNAPPARDIFSPPLERVAWAGVFSLAPALAWQINEGHVYYASSLPVFAAALICAARMRHCGLSGFLLLFASATASFETTSFPALGNAAVFTGLVLVLLTLALRPWPMPAAILLALSCLGPIFFAAPGIMESLAHFTGSDSSRAGGGPEVVYSYVTATWRDWLTSLPWTFRPWPTGRDPFLFHETNWPIGPFALFLAFGLATRLRLFTGTLLAFSALGMLFASRVEPFASLVLALAPPLQKFRVPARVLFPLILLSAPFALAALRAAPGWHKFSAHGKQDALVALLLALGAGGCYVFLPYVAGELVLWTAALLLTLHAAEKIALSSPVRSALAFVLLFAAAAAMSERLDAKHDMRRTERNASELRAQILAKAPALADPLTRASTRIVDTKIYTNTARVLDISSINGYWQPQRRFNELFQNIVHGRDSELAINMAIAASHPDFPFLASLYNIAFDLTKDEQGAVLAIPQPSAIGPAWFAGPFRGFPALKDALAFAKAETNFRPNTHPWFLAEDTKAAPYRKRLATLPPCQNRRVLGHKILAPHFAAEFQVERGPACVLGVALNYAENLRAYDARDMRPLNLVPVYGALVGVLTPPETEKILLRAETMVSAGVRILPFAGGACFLAATLLFLGFPNRTRGKR